MPVETAVRRNLKHYRVLQHPCHYNGASPTTYHLVLSAPRLHIGGLRADALWEHVLNSATPEEFLLQTGRPLPQGGPQLTQPAVTAVAQSSMT